MNKSNIQTKNKNKFFVASIAIVVALALLASTVIVINDASAALSDPRDSLGIRSPGTFISNGFITSNDVSFDQLKAGVQVGEEDL